MSLKKPRGVLQFRSVIRPFLLASFPIFVIAQTPPQKPAPQGGGVSTGTPVNYSWRRTAGVTDPKAPIVFEDVTAKTVLANFKHRSGSPEKNYIFETRSAGVAIFDNDGDVRPNINWFESWAGTCLRGRAD